MAHIRRHPVKPDSWQVRYRDPNGKERSKTFRRRIDARNHLIRIEADIQAGSWVDPRRAATKFAEFAERWLKTRSHLKPKTLQGYESLLRNHVLPRFGNTRMDRIETLEIEAWVADLQAAGLSPSRIRQAYQVLHAVLKAAVKSRYLNSNTAMDIKLPPIRRREMSFLSPSEIHHLADAIHDPYATLVYLMAYTGIRWGEAAALRRGRVDVLRATIQITESLAEIGGDLIFGATKNQKDRTINLPRFLRDLLNEYLGAHVPADPAALVFTSPTGKPLRNSNFRRRVWAPALERAGLGALRLHDLRHSCVAVLVAQGAHPQAIKEQLGHSSIMVTMDLYGHLYPSDMEALAARLDDLYHVSAEDKSRTNNYEAELVSMG